MLDDCSRWSDSPQRDPQSLYSALSQNLVRYKELHKKKSSTKRYQRPMNAYNTIDNQNDKQNSISLTNYLNRPINPLTHRVCLQPLKNYQKRVNSVKGQRQHGKQDEMKSVRVRQVRFEKKDRKKVKDRWVDVIMHAGSRSQKISLLKLDNINKQGRDQKIDMFLKLLKR